MIRSVAARAAGAVLARELDDPVVEPLRRGVHRLLQLGGDQAVRAPEERLRDAVELFAEPVAGLLADRAHPVLELERARLAARVDLARHARARGARPADARARRTRPRSRVRASLSARSTCSVTACSCWRSRSFSSSTVRRRSSACAESSSSARASASRAPVSSSSRSRIAAARCSSIAASSSSDSAGDARLDVRDALPHPLLERGDCALERVLGAFEVGLPRAQPLFHPLLDGGDELRHAVRELALAHGELAAPLVGEPALLGDVGGERVGLSARDRDAQLLGLRRRLLLGRRANRPSRFGHELLGARARARARRGGGRARATTVRRTATISAATRIQARVVTPETLDSECDQSGREQDGRRREQPQPSLLGGDETIRRRAARASRREARARPRPTRRAGGRSARGSRARAGRARGATANAAARNAATLRSPATAAYPHTTGKPPHASPNQRSEWNRPPRSSRL